MAMTENTAAAALRELNERMAEYSFPLAEIATQPVFGSGAAPSRLMLLGEQPGEQEGLEGRVFIGAAGKLLDRALAEAGIKREEIYIANTLKHCKFRREGECRKHEVPNLSDIKLYLPWLQAEIAIVLPRVVVTLGSVAAQAATGKNIAVETSRSRSVAMGNGLLVMPTYHPAYIVRTPERAMKEARYRRLVEDLAAAAVLAEKG